MIGASTLTKTTVCNRDSNIGAHASDCYISSCIFIQVSQNILILGWLLTCHSIMLPHCHNRWFVMQECLSYVPILSDILSPVKLGPVVQSVVSLTSSLRVILLTVLADSIYNILIFSAEKMRVAFALQKLLTFFQQKISAYLCITRCKF